MSTYNLQSTRPRPPPPPLRLHKSALKQSSATVDNQLLYDLPTSLSTPPPDGPTSFQALISPTSPTSAGRSRARAGGRHRTPPPRNRSSTPQPLPDEELDQFASNCRSWYYDQDEEAGRWVTQTLTTLQPSRRAQFTRLQATIRAAFHAHLAARRRAEFQAHITSTTPGGSLLPVYRSNPDGTQAKLERLERLDRFIKTWCNVGMAGTKPFFEGLWAIMRLQVLPESLGGAGSRRIEWELDDAIFMESAGKEFMLEAIDVLKGVLGFEERLSNPSLIRRLSNDALGQSHSRSQSEPLSKSLASPSQPQKLATPSVSPARRSRAPSDPFLDTNSLSESPLKSNNQPLPRLTRNTQHDDDDNYFPSIMTSAADRRLSRTGADRLFDEQGDSQYLRVWTAPDLSNPEYNSFLKLFPTHLCRRTLPRFPATTTRATTRTKHTQPDLEEGDFDDSEEMRCEVRVGSGVMWIGTKERSESWRGNWWERFKAWWRRVLC